MRKVIDLQMEFWKKEIANIEFDLQSRIEDFQETFTKWRKETDKTNTRVVRVTKNKRKL